MAQAHHEQHRLLMLSEHHLEGLGITGLVDLLVAAAAPNETAARIALRLCVERALWTAHGLGAATVVRCAAVEFPK